jgi:hypothetical protein
MMRFFLSMNVLLFYNRVGLHRFCFPLPGICHVFNSIDCFYSHLRFWSRRFVIPLHAFFTPQNMTIRLTTGRHHPCRLLLVCWICFRLVYILSQIQVVISQGVRFAVLDTNVKFMFHMHTTLTQCSQYTTRMKRLPVVTMHCYSPDWCHIAPQDVI